MTTIDRETVRRLVTECEGLIPRDTTGEIWTICESALADNPAATREDIAAIIAEAREEHAANVAHDRSNG